MIEILTIDKVTVIGVLLAVCWYLVKSNSKHLDSLSERHREERERLIDEYKNLKEESKQERKEWLLALSDNTKMLNNIADKLNAIPFMQKDLDELKIKVDVFTRNNGGCK